MYGIVMLRLRYHLDDFDTICDLKYVSKYKNMMMMMSNDLMCT